MDVPFNNLISQAKFFFSPLGDISSRSQFGGYSLAADRVMFGLILDDRLYLRGTRQSEHIFKAQGMRRLIYTKRGIPVSLNYYLVDERLWREAPTLLGLARHAVNEARQESRAKAANLRLKDLPNIGQGIERLLWKAGIQDIDALRHYGAKSSYLKLRKIKKNLSVKVLYALEGAISGRHYAALPQCQRSELLAWFERLSCR